MPQLHCPKCDAPIDAPPESTGKICCWRCLHTFAPESHAEISSEANGLLAHHDWSVHVPAFPGKGAIRLVKRVAGRSAFTTCPACSADVLRRSMSCPHCGHKLRKHKRQWLTKADWRRIGIAIVVFVGVPAATIFFLVVVCAPRHPLPAQKPLPRIVKTR